MSRTSSLALILIGQVLARQAYAQTARSVERDTEEPTPPGVVVELRANSQDVRIVRVDSGQQTTVCAPPCGESLPRQGVYQIAGRGVVPTAKFTLPEGQSQLQLQVRAGSEGLRTTGVVLVVGGVMTFAAGGAYFLYTAFTTPFDTPGNPRSLDIAAALDGAGLLMAGLGLLLAVTTSTNVITSRGVTFSQASPRQGRTGARRVRRRCRRSG